MSNNDFIGPFKNVAPLYIDYKKSLGYKSEAEFNELNKLDRYFYNKNIKELSTLLISKNIVSKKVIFLFSILCFPHNKLNVKNL